MDVTHSELHLNHARFRSDGIGDAAVGYLTLDRADRANALNDALVDDLEACVEAAQRDALDVLVIDGAGRNFCAGLDLTPGLESSVLVQRFLRIEGLFAELGRLNAITIALVHGGTIGAGADLAVACDYRVVMGDCRLRFPGWGFGVALGTRRLADLIGRRPALDLLLSGRFVSTDEALGLGLVTRLVPDADAAESAVTSIAEAATRLDRDARAQLLSITRNIPSSEDLGELAWSMRRDGLADRIERYRSASVRREQGAER